MRTTVLFCLALAAQVHAGPEWRRGVVSCGDPAATECGLAVLKSGGNAVDAAVAVGFMLGVVDARNSGIGGGCFLLIRLGNGAVVAIDGRETAPMRSRPDMFRREGRAVPELSQTGPLSMAVPGALAAYAFAAEKYGSRLLEELLEPAAKHAEVGFRVSRSYARALQEVEKDMARFASTTQVFFRNGRPLAEGELLRQPDLARTYRAIAREGTDWFYRGSFAVALDQWMAANGGIMTAADLAGYRVRLREPIITEYRGHTVIGFPPPSSGGVHVAQILKILEPFNLRLLSPDLRLHLVADAMKLAFADRAHWLGDPAFARVPRGLIDPAYAASLRLRLDPQQAVEVRSHGNPPAADTEVFRGHTTHFSVADAEGNWVACTATLNTTFGSKVVIPGTGVVMNNQMDDFVAQAGTTNYFGLVGGEANAVAPGKRPLSSMSPTIVCRAGTPVLALGGAGGPRIISQVLLQLVNVLDLEMSAAEACAAPRLHHQWQPQALFVEETMPAALTDGLRRRGHEVRISRSMGITHSVARDPVRGVFSGAADPRGDGKVAGY